MRIGNFVWAVLVVGACGSSASEPASEPASERTSARTSERASERTSERTAELSSIRAADYIGPDACGECHPVQHAAWTTSLHRRMNQRAEGAVIGDFSNVTVRYAGGQAHFLRVPRAGGGVDHVMELLAPGGARRRYRVTRTIGVRALQEYVGVALDAREPVEVRLPFAWWPRRAGWYPQPYFDPWFAREQDFDAYAPLREPWAARCPWCHSTYPFAQRIARASAREVGHGFEQFFARSGGAPGGASGGASGAAPGADPERLAVEQQVTTGISCESCHLGGRAHAAGAPIHFVPLGAPARADAPRPTTFATERADPAIVNRVCAQCHSGPSPRLADGTALRNSSEALDLAAAPCTTARCVDCHDPHTGGSDEARAIAACTGCHAQLADAASARAHAGHDARAASCLDCHMPRLVMGIDRIVRTHRISSPSNAAIVGAGGPNACNLCHVDRSLAWTLAELRARWDVAIAPRGIDPEQPVGEAWLANAKEPALRILAADAISRSPLAQLFVPALKQQLADPLPHVRVWTLFAIETVLGRRIADNQYDPREPGRTLR